MGWSRPRLQTCQLSPRAGRPEGLVELSAVEVWTKRDYFKEPLVRPMPHPVVEVVLPCPRASVGDDFNPSVE